MTTIPESTPGTASPREHPAPPRLPSKVQERLQSGQGAPIRERQILRQESETKPIPTVPAPPPGGLCEPGDEPTLQVAAGARQVSRAAAEPELPS